MVLKFIKYKKMSENHDNYLDVMISYHEALVKTLRRFRTTMSLRRINPNIFGEDSVFFEVKMTVELEFHVKTFYISLKQYNLVDVKV